MNKESIASSRAEARSLGLKLYRPNKPCPSGHEAPRFVSNFGCSECLRVNNAQYQERNRDTLLVKKRQWARKNPDKNREQSSRWQKENWAKAYEMQRAAFLRKWDSHYKYLWRHYSNKRRAALLSRTPSWADLGQIELIYKNCPDGMAVDHIIPLRGKKVSGLHVESNLQYLTKAENSSKGNRYEVLG